MDISSHKLIKNNFRKKKLWKRHMKIRNIAKSWSTTKRFHRGPSMIKAPQSIPSGSLPKRHRGEKETTA